MKGKSSFLLDPVCVFDIRSLSVGGWKDHLNSTGCFRKQTAEEGEREERIGVCGGRTGTIKR